MGQKMEIWLKKIFFSRKKVEIFGVSYGLFWFGFFIFGELGFFGLIWRRLKKRTRQLLRVATEF